MALWGGRFTQAADQRFKQFNDSLRFDYRLAEQDIIGSVAWSKALVTVNVLTQDEQQQLEAALNTLLDEVREEYEWQLQHHAEEGDACSRQYILTQTLTRSSRGGDVLGREAFNMYLQMTAGQERANATGQSKGGAMEVKRTNNIMRRHAHQQLMHHAAHDEHGDLRDHDRAPAPHERHEDVPFHELVDRAVPAGLQRSAAHSEGDRIRLDRFPPTPTLLV